MIHCETGRKYLKTAEMPDTTTFTLVAGWLYLNRDDIFSDHNNDVTAADVFRFSLAATSYLITEVEEA